MNLNWTSRSLKQHCDTKFSLLLSCYVISVLSWYQMRYPVHPASVMLQVFWIKSINDCCPVHTVALQNASMLIIFWKLYILFLASYTCKKRVRKCELSVTMSFVCSCTLCMFLVTTTDYERGSWSSASSSSAAASRLGAIAVPCINITISFSDHRLHGTHAHISEIHSQQFGVRATQSWDMRVVVLVQRLVEEGWSSCRSCCPRSCSSSAPPGSSSTSSWWDFHPTLPVPMVLFLVSTRPRELLGVTILKMQSQ